MEDSKSKKRKEHLRDCSGSREIYICYGSERRKGTLWTEEAGLL